MHRTQSVWQRSIIQTTWQDRLLERNGGAPLHLYIVGIGSVLRPDEQQPVLGRYRIAQFLRPPLTSVQLFLITPVGNTLLGEFFRELIYRLLVLAGVAEEDLLHGWLRSRMVNMPEENDRVNSPPREKELGSVA